MSLSRQRFSGIKSRGSWLAMLMAGALACTQPAHAADPLIEGGRLCTQQFPIQEQQYHIPTHLLAAISNTESGRYHKGLGMSVPWPWTINVEGKGYHFNSKAEAIAQTKQLMEKGHRSIDVGCMQVNLKHHAKAFRNLEEAFDPQTNVAYAARFLRDNYAGLGDWIKATAAYHSRTQVHGQRYLTQIERNWNKIVAKVAAARASAGQGSTLPAAQAMPQAQQAATNTPIPQPKALKPQGVRNVSSSHDRVIKVSDAPRSNGSEILVIRGATATQESVPKEPVAEFSPQPAGDSVRRVTLDKTPANAQENPTKFVFVD